MTRLERLSAYVAEVSHPDHPKAPVIGVDDCGPWVMRWVERELGVETGFPRYATREEGHAIAAAAGGLAKLAAPLLSAVGLYDTVTPEAGDVGVIRFTDREIAVIIAEGGFVVMRDERLGARLVSGRCMVKAWSLPR